MSKFARSRPNQLSTVIARKQNVFVLKGNFFS